MPTSTNAPAVFKDFMPSLGWSWLSADGYHRRPVEMGTNHLFYTFRMIWNNSMPPEFRVGKVKLYTFDQRTHPNKYLGEAIFHCGHELMHRWHALERWQKAEILQMARHLGLWRQPWQITQVLMIEEGSAHV